MNCLDHCSGILPRMLICSMVTFLTPFFGNPASVLRCTTRFVAAKHRRPSMSSTQDIFEMGPATLRFSPRLHPLLMMRYVGIVRFVCCRRISRKKLHSGTRRKLRDAMQQACSGDQLGVALLRGGGPFHIYSTDMEGIFRYLQFCMPQCGPLCTARLHRAPAKETTHC